MLEKLESKVSRREFLIGAGKAGVALVAVSVLGCEKEPVKTWQDLEKEFSKKPLDLETAKNIIILLAARDYVRFSGTRLAEQELINAVKFGKTEKPSVGGQTAARQDILIDLEKFLGEPPVVNPQTQEETINLVSLRSALYHEFFHFDVNKKLNTSLIPLTNPPDGSTVLEVEAFFLRSQTKKTLFQDFNEFVTDIFACELARRVGVEYTISYDGTSALESFFKYKNIVIDELIPLYRESDFEALALKIGSTVNLPFEQQIADGIRVIEWFDKENWQQLKNTFPEVGFIFKPTTGFICK